MVKDADIRPVLLKDLKAKFSSIPNSLIIEEFGLCQGAVRIDVAVINGSLNGYEIKSEKDTLKRLHRQKEIYNEIFDTITLVTCKNHLNNASKAIPSWWGLSEIKLKKNKILINTIRSPIKNKNINPSHLVQLLWKNEALELLKDRDLHKGFISKPREILWNRLIECLPLEELKTEIRNRIKMRQNWRVD